MNYARSLKPKSSLQTHVSLSKQKTGAKYYRNLNNIRMFNPRATLNNTHES